MIYLFSSFCADVCLFIYCSFADLQKPQTELDGKACAGVGQSSLMAYYETMFDQVILLFLEQKWKRIYCTRL